MNPAYEELPQSDDPSSGILATANHDMTGHFADEDPTNDMNQPVGVKFCRRFPIMDIAIGIMPEALGNQFTTDAQAPSTDLRWTSWTIQF